METKHKIKVAVSCIFYPLSMASYFIRALQRRDDVELFTVGPFTGDRIPWDGNMRLPMKYVFTPDIALPEGFAGQRRMDFGMVQSRMPWKPDLWLQIDAGFHFANRPDASVVALVKTDPHVLNDHYAEIDQAMDYSFCMQMPYMRPRDRYLPYGYDPEYHCHMDGIIQEYDGCLIGLHYEQRDRLVDHLRGKGYSVYYSIGEIYREYQLKYNQSRVALCWSSLLDLPARAWEAMAMGVPLLINRNIPDLSNFFVEGEHYLGFENVEEAGLQFRELISNEEFRLNMAGNAWRKVKDFHSWDTRIDQIFDVCGFRMTR